MKRTSLRRLTLSLAALTFFGALTPALAAPSTPQAGAYAPPLRVLAEDQETIERNAHPTVLAETDQIIVKFAKDVSEQTKESIVEELTDTTAVTESADIVKETIAGAEVIDAGAFLDKAEQAEAVEKLEENPNVEYAEPDYIIAGGLAAIPGNPPNDPHYAGYQWNMRAIDAAGAWRFATGQGIRIGVADTGQTSHPDLNGKMLPGYDFVSTIDHSRDGDGRDPNPNDEGDWGPHYSLVSTWHGTHVAGIAAASTDNGIGVAGVAPNAQIQHARVMGKDGTTYVSDQAAGVAWSAGVPQAGVPNNPTPSHVVNFSEGIVMPTGRCPQVMQDAVNLAHARNVPVIASAGNQGINANTVMPANCLGAIVVGSTSINNTMVGYSNWGPMLDVLAPGGNSAAPLWSTKNTGTYTQGAASYGYLHGTSMAAPHVTGIVALMKERDPNLSVERIREILKATGTSVNGYLMVNARKATEAVVLVPRFALTGAIGNYYWGRGGATHFGQPLGAEFPLRDGGYAQNFDSGTTIYWSPFTGAAPVYFNGAIGSFYRTAGYENAYGYPTDAEHILGPGAIQNFRTATGVETALIWSPQGGVQTLNLKGALYWHWRNNGFTRTLGYPVTGEVPQPDGSITVTFTSGVKLRWTPTGGVTRVGFTDITGSSFAQEIRWLSQAGISTGWSDGTYRPYQTVSRADIAAFLYRLAGSPTYTAPTTPNFKDLPTTHPFYHEISWLAENGISTGWSDGTYRPDQAINRDAMAAFFYRMAGEPAHTAATRSPFTDITANDMFYHEVSWFAATGITTGWLDGTFRPRATVTREAMAAFMYRADQKQLLKKRG
ncbi:S8 family serine peptidase [Rothia sp. ZJ932]|uniref:S8 family serine peptidase n=1 Tax=Rothia sp. ZJ932 TaxID=2810516 RepID=UPI001F07BAFE|nr:S8 family serine peptidase [Rothia sp. ZJ932]